MARDAAPGVVVACLLASSCTMAQSRPTSGEPAKPPGELALEIVAEHLSTGVDELELVRIEPVEWRDSAIGCPDPGMDYQQVITPGHFALVRDANGATHRVHMAGDHGIVCDRALAKSGNGPQPMPTFSQSQLEALARADLGQRLGVPASEVSVIDTRRVEWPDASLSCETDETPSAGAASKGFIIELAHDERRYTYRTDLRHVIPCPPIESQ